jgi:putative ATP-binding cassette transporter
MFNAQRRVWAQFLRSLRLFFTSEARRPAITWFVLLLALLATLSGLNVVNSYIGRDFMTAISDRRWTQFVHYAFLYAGVFALSTVMSAFYRFSEERLRLLWRNWMTRVLIDRYMSRNAFYRLNDRDEIDNPDERITEDVKSYTQTTLSFFLMSLNALITSLAFLGVLWSITPWLVVVAGLYAAVGSTLTILLGRPLVRLDNLQLQREADLRYHLIQTRETAAAIATMHMDQTVTGCLRARLAEVVGNNKNIIRVTRNLNFFVNGYNYLIQLIPLLIVAPMYIQGRVEFGVVTQSAMAFSAFLGAFSLIVTQFETLSSFAAVTSRLDTIVQAIEQAQSPAALGIHIVEEPGRVAYEGLTLRTPRDHRPLIKDLALEVPYGRRLLITGPDMTAETALFLATAGIWEEGEGRIIRPARGAIAFVPKQPITVRCTLRSQLIAGSCKSPVRDGEILAVLEKLGLGSMVGRVGGLDADVHSPSALSPVEQRLLIFARVLLMAPRFVFVDRISTDLGTDQVAKLYQLLQESSISYLSIGDRRNLRPYHDTELEIQGVGRWQVCPIPGRAAVDGAPAERSTSASPPAPSGARE